MSPEGDCSPWKLFPHAQFTLTRLTARGEQLSGTRRTVRSDADAEFRVVLRPGTYLVKPVRGLATKGGRSFRVHVSAGATARITVRFAARFRPV